LRQTAVAVFVFAGKFLFFRFFVKRGQLPAPYQFLQLRPAIGKFRFGFRWAPVVFVPPE